MRNEVENFAQLPKSSLLLIVALAFAVIAIDLVAGWRWSPAWRMLPAIGFLLIVATKWQIFPYDCGFKTQLLQSWWYWWKMGIAVGAAVLTFCALAFVVAKLCKVPLHFRPLFTDSRQFWPWLLFACISTPIVEETIYRGVLCPPLESLVGSNTTIIISGAIFAGLHFVYGNASPDNFIAGYALTWAFVKSRSILIPVIMHAAGNLFVATLHLLYYYHPQIFEWLF